MTPEKRSSKVRSVIAATLVTLAGICVTSSSAPAATTPSGLDQTVTVGHTNVQAGQPTSVVITTSLSQAGGGTPSPTTEIDIQFPNGLVRNSGSLPTCNLSDLLAQGPVACEAARVGAGTLTMDVRPVVLDPVYATLDAFNGPNGALYIFVLPDLGPTFVMTGTPVGTALNISIPIIDTLPSVPPAAITQIQLGLGSGSYLVNPTTSCPWTYTFGFHYANNETLSIPATASCTPGSLPGPGPQDFVLALAPKSATLSVGAQHCVTATVSFAGVPLEGELVRFSVGGANAGAAAALRADAAGNARFCYTGARAGGDTISAFADDDENGTQDPGEPGDTASATFMAPPAVASSPPPAVASSPPPAKAKGCVVPKVRGLNLKKAKKKLGKAGCRYKIRGKGRVVSTRPSAGARTEKTVLVKAKSKKAKKKKGKIKRKRRRG